MKEVENEHPLPAGGRAQNFLWYSGTKAVGSDEAFQGLGAGMW